MMIKRRLKNAEQEDKEAFRHIVERYKPKPSATPSHPGQPRGRHGRSSRCFHRYISDHFDRIDLTRRFYPWFYVIVRKSLLQTGSRTKEATDEHGGMKWRCGPTASVRPEDAMLLERAMLELPAEDRN